jgi:hypothetical protein
MTAIAAGGRPEERAKMVSRSEVIFGEPSSWTKQEATPSTIDILCKYRVQVSPLV